MRFLFILRAEVLKYRSKMSLLWIVLPLILVLLLGSQMKQIVAMDPSRQNWSFFFQLLAAHWGLFLATPFWVFWSTHNMVMEQSNWKLLTCQGISRGQLFQAKAGATVGLILLQALVLGLFFLVAGHWLNLEGPIPWDRLSLLAATCLTALPIIATQMFLATFSPRLLPLLAVGLFGHFTSLLATRFPVGRYLPWSFTLEALKLRGPESLTHPIYLAAAIIIGCAMLTAGLHRFKKHDL